MLPHSFEHPKCSDGQPDLLSTLIISTLNLKISYSIIESHIGRVDEIFPGISARLQTNIDVRFGLFENTTWCKKIKPSTFVSSTTYDSRLPSSICLEHRPLSTDSIQNGKMGCTRVRTIDNSVGQNGTCP